MSQKAPDINPVKIIQFLLKFSLIEKPIALQDPLATSSRSGKAA